MLSIWRLKPIFPIFPFLGSISFPFLFPKGKKERGVEIKAVDLVVETEGFPSFSRGVPMYFSAFLKENYGRLLALTYGFKDFLRDSYPF